jgi:hypothetical protein
MRTYTTLKTVLYITLLLPFIFLIHEARPINVRVESSSDAFSSSPFQALSVVFLDV